MTQLQYNVGSPIGDGFLRLSFVLVQEFTDQFASRQGTDYVRCESHVVATTYLVMLLREILDATTFITGTLGKVNGMMIANIQEKVDDTYVHGSGARTIRATEDNDLDCENVGCPMRIAVMSESCVEEVSIGLSPGALTYVLLIDVFCESRGEQLLIQAVLVRDFRIVKLKKYGEDGDSEGVQATSLLAVGNIPVKMNISDRLLSCVLDVADLLEESFGALASLQTRLQQLQQRLQLSLGCSLVVLLDQCLYGPFAIVKHTWAVACWFQLPIESQLVDTVRKHFLNLRLVDKAIFMGGGVDRDSNPTKNDQPNSVTLFHAQSAITKDRDFRGDFHILFPTFIYSPYLL